MESALTEESAPQWVAQQVLPNVDGHVRSVHVITNKSVLVFGVDHALYAERGGIGGVKLFRIDYPPGLLINTAKCPHCGEAIVEPIGKIARVAEETPPAKKGRGPKGKASG